MHDPHTLHVLRPSPVDVALLVHVGGEGGVGPVLGEHRDHVRVRVEDDGGERGVRPLKSFKRTSEKFHNDQTFSQ